MQQQTFDAELIDYLQSGLKGVVIRPGDDGYDDARRVWLKGVDRRPAAIVKVADAADVARVVTLARESGTEIAVRSGGHSFGGYGTCDEGWVIDLSGMKGLELDVEGRTAWADAGLTAGEYTAAAGAHGLATPFGDSPSVGLGGLTIGGGMGFLHRKLGLTIDNLLAAEVVTADGSVLRVDERSHPDLFWAVRGGGGNFGVVTRFQYRLHEVSEVYGGMLMLPATPAHVASIVQYLLDAPDELSGVLAVMKAPPMPMIPAEYHGAPVIFAMLVNLGDATAGEAAFAPIRSLATPLIDMVQPLQYPQLFDEHGGPEHVAMAFRSTFMDTFSQADAELALDRILTSSAKMCALQFRVLGGAVARVPRDATAFAHRSRAMLAGIVSSFDREDERATHDQWVSHFASDLGQGEPASFCNFLTPSLANVREAYPGATVERLVRVKRTYDPANLFKLNVNITP